MLGTRDGIGQLLLFLLLAGGLDGRRDDIGTLLLFILLSGYGDGRGIF